MRRITIICFLSLTLISGIAFSDMLVGSESVNRTELTISRSDQEVIDIDFRFSGVNIERVSSGIQNFDLLSMESEGVSGVLGAPEVPLITRLFAIPDRAKVRVISVEPQYNVYSGINPLPHQDHEYGNPHHSDNWQVDEKYYIGGEVFPEKWVSLGEPAILRDYRIIPVTVSPVRVNAYTGEVMVLTSLHVELALEDGGTQNVKTHHFDKTVTSFNQMYRSKIANLDWVNPNGVEVKGSILIIYPNVTGVASTLQPYIEWKKRKGYNTLTSQVSNNASTTTVFNIIQSAYNSADPPLEHVILVGDAAGSIDISCYTMGGGASDHPYTQLEGGDILGDISIGRLSVGNTSDLQVVVNKILYYEKEPTLTSTSWYKQGAVVAQSSWSGFSTIQLNQSIRSWLLGIGYTQVDSFFYGMPGNPDDFQINECNNVGISALNFRGWQSGGLSSSQILGLNNNGRIPYAVQITCNTGDFGGNSADESEAWLRAGTASQPKGGIACVGTATASTKTRFNNTIASGLWFGLIQEGIHELGPSLFRGKLELFNAYQQDFSYVQNFSYWNNLMGDPTTDMWSDIPQILTVTHPDEIPVGTSSFTVQVEDGSGNPLEDRYVCLWKGDETYIAGRTDENGIYTAPIDVPTAGDLKVTVTYHNDYPYLADVPVVASEINPSFYDLTIVDDNTGQSQGNGDGVANPGEVLELGVDLKNFGTLTTATSVSGILTTDDPFVTITNGTVNYSDITPGSVVSGTSHYVVEMSGDFPQGYKVQFELTVHTAQGDFISAFDYDVTSGQSLVRELAFTGGLFNPGDTDNMTVTVQNVGELNLTGVTATITTQDAQVEIIDGEATFGNINAGALVANTSNPFVISADVMAVNGHNALFTLHLTSTNGSMQDINFYATIGQVSSSDPFGPDMYGYYCIDNSDVSITGHPTWQWIEIDPTQGGVAGTQLFLPDNGNEQDVSTSFVLPFDFTYYGETFDTLTVCSNGWLGFGDEDYHDDFRNYMLPTSFGPQRGMLCPFWDNLVMGGGHVYVYHDEVNHTVIVEYSRVAHQSGGLETFEAILYDPAFYPTPTGDGEIVFQYLDVSVVVGPIQDNDYFTTGIMSNDHMDGLQYAYWNVYSPAAATVSTGRAIKFTTVEPLREELSTDLTITIDPVNPPIIIPANGGSFNYNAELVNNSSTMNSVCDVWMLVMLPDSSIYGPLFMKPGLDLAPNGMRDKLITQFVPGGAMAGVYTYSAYAGNYHDNIIYTQDSFTFEKTGADLSAGGNWNTYGWEDDIDSDVDGSTILPSEYSLKSAYPNPFNPTTEIAFALPQAGKISIGVYNSLGQQVAILADGWMNAGWHTVEFNAENLSSGLYFYTMKTDNFTQTKKMLLLK